MEEFLHTPPTPARTLVGAVHIHAAMPFVFLHILVSSAFLHVVLFAAHVGAMESVLVLLNLPNILPCAPLQKNEFKYKTFRSLTRCCWFQCHRFETFLPSPDKNLSCSCCFSVRGESNISFLME